MASWDSQPGTWDSQVGTWDSGAVVPPVIGIGGGAGVGPRRLKIHRHFFFTEEPVKKKPPKPTRERVHEVAETLFEEAEGVLGNVPAGLLARLERGVADAYPAGATWAELEARWSDLLNREIERVERARARERARDEEEVEMLLLLH